MRGPVIDTHIHFWHPEQLHYFWLADSEPLCRPFLPEALDAERRAAGVVAGIYVQASHDPRENAWALDLARRVGWIRGVVGWLDLTAPLEKPADPLFKGVRHLTHAIPDRLWLRRADVGHALDRLAEWNLSVDLVVRAEQLPEAERAIREHPGTTFILDHLGNPPLEGDLTRWQDDLSSVAALPNVAVKLSGLLTHFTAPVDETRLAEAVRHGLNVFGPERVMYGGDWPVSTLKTPYLTTLDTLARAAGPLADARLWWENACRYYRLDREPA
ncbi:amidohydrolase family protein [Deinococcus metallilatus]|uniref:L-fuconolactonase n=1 Tax=Deinococcus metallilatus TaxID=1211322 RepID=A0ABR6MNI6_9DEIO|nr:amidohydrolase family protein [Deinococcus metallilatus]MBB5293508.1 L-fuconolactonase [Deinococcus metallilatus]GMA15272.1 amidohydrolase [Deinococcus metallilatus]